MNTIPEPKRDRVPETWREFSEDIGQHGTLVVWSDLDFERLTWKRAERALLRTEEIVGRVYRNFIADDTVKIRLHAIEEDNNNVLIDRETKINDPLYLAPIMSLPPPFNERPMFEDVFNETHEIEYKGHVYPVITRYSIATEDTISEAGTFDRGSTKYGETCSK